MKHFYCILLLILLCNTQYTAAQKTYVLVVGISDYQAEGAQLRQTSKDAKAFADIMKTQTPHVTLLTSKFATRANIFSKLQTICKNTRIEDRIVFFFSGHGIPGGLYTYDGDADKSYIYYAELVQMLKTAKAREKISFIDACHAGSLLQGLEANTSEWSDSATQSGQVFFLSSRKEEYSHESSLVGSGFFTRALLKGIQGKSDDDGNKQITVIKLFKYIYNDVVRRSKSRQHPQLIAKKELYDIIVTNWN